MPKLTALFAGTTLAAGIAVVYLWQQLHAERLLTAELRQQGVRAGAILPQRSSQSLPSEVATAGMTPVAVNVPGTGVLSNAGAVSTPSAVAPTVVMGTAIKPEKVATSLKLNEMERNFPSLAKELGMTPAEAEKFYDLLTRAPAAFREAINAGVTDPQELARLRADFEKTQKADIAAMLGPARTQQWQEYQTTLEARRRVNELTMMLASTSPLDERQSAALVANIVAEQRRRAQEESLRMPAPNDPRAQLEFEEHNLQIRIESNRRTVEAARSFMTPEQVTLMQDSQARANDRTRAALQARREQLEGVRP